VEAGGETFFRRSSGCSVQAFQDCALPAEQPTSAVNSQGGSVGVSGLRIPPKKGRAIMFGKLLLTQLQLDYKKAGIMHARLHVQLTNSRHTSM